MNATKKAIAFVIMLFLVVTVVIVYIFSELYTESEIEEAKTNEDAIKFKEEYEKINGVSAGEDKIYRSLEISEDNPFIYSTAEEIVEKIDNKESFIVYFGFNECPWCRSVLMPLLESAKENNIDKIYYVDVKEDVRDTYVLDDNHNLIKSIEGSKAYYDLLDRLNNILSEYRDLSYTTTNKKKKKITKYVKVPEKRIYAPNVIIIKNGVGTNLVTGKTEELTDPYMEIDEEMFNEIKSIFDAVFKPLNTACTDEEGC